MFGGDKVTVSSQMSTCLIWATRYWIKGPCSCHKLMARQYQVAVMRFEREQWPCYRDDAVVTTVEMTLIMLGVLETAQIRVIYVQQGMNGGTLVDQ